MKVCVGQGIHTRRLNVDFLKFIVTYYIYLTKIASMPVSVIYTVMCFFKEVFNGTIHGTMMNTN